METKEVKLICVKLGFKEFILSKLNNLAFFYLVNITLFILDVLKNLILVLVIPLFVWGVLQMLYFFFIPHSREKWVVEL